LTQADLLQLQNYDWPGNVRELQNVIERAVIISKGNRLRLDIERAPVEPQATEKFYVGQEPGSILTETEMRQMERQNIEKALIHSSGKVYGERGAARLLGLPPTTLTARINKLGIKKDRS